MTNEELIGIGLIVLIIATIVWPIRGFIRMCGKHGTILMIVYVVLLFPLAYTHAFFVGAFGRSNKKRMEDEAEELARLDVIREQTKQKMMAENDKAN